jgi:outer membrane immunogenic protein
MLVASPALGADLGGPKTLTPADAAALPGTPWSACWGGVEIGGSAAILDPWGGIDGWGGGLRAGCDVQLGHFVTGLRGGYDWVHLNAGNAPISVNANEWYLGGRGGLLLTEKTLAYGLVDFVQADLSGSGISERVNGWGIGGGIEHMWTPHLSSSLEYRLEQFGNINGGREEPVDLREHTIRLGLTYKFQGLGW